MEERKEQKKGEKWLFPCFEKQYLTFLNSINFLEAVNLFPCAAVSPTFSDGKRVACSVCVKVLERDDSKRATVRCPIWKL